MRKRERNLVFILMLLLLCISCQNQDLSMPGIVTPSQRIINLLDKADETKDSIRLDYLGEAQKLAKIHQLDSVWLLIGDKRTNSLYRYGYYTQFKLESTEFLKKAIEIDDSLNIASGHYKLGSYYLKTFVYDSAYYYFNEAQESYKHLDDSLRVASNLLNMAIIQSRISDYYGSEETSLEALNYVSPKKGKRYLLSLYNNLGIVSVELGQYRDALYWYNQARYLISKVRERYILENNIGVVYRKEKNYAQAIKQFEKTTVSASDGFPLIYAMALDNLGYTKFLENHDALDLLRRAYKIRINGKSISGQIVSQLHLAEYHVAQNNSDSAYFYLEAAYKNTQEIKDTKNALEALDMLYGLSGKQDFLEKRTRIKDSIILAERSLKHELTKIKYRTQKQEELNSSLTIDNQKNRSQKIIFIITTSLSLLAFILAWLFFKQRQRTTRQQAIIEKLEARAEEKDQLSLYLHDDIASDVVVGLQQAEKLQSQSFNKDWEKVLYLFNGAYEKMRGRSQELNLQHFSVIPFEKKLKTLCAEIGNTSTTVLHSGIEDVKWTKIPPQIKMNIYVIIQEAFINIGKHAQASEVLLIISQNTKHLNLRIQDDGIGYHGGITNGIGVYGMRKRVEEMDGTLNISALPTKGTQLTIQLPMVWQ